MKIEFKEKQKDQPSDASKPVFDFKYAKQVLNYGAPYPKEDWDGTSMGYAAHYCRSRSVRELILRRATIDEKDGNGSTPLMKAGFGAITADIVAGCGSEISELLLKHGSDINARDKKGFTPLMYAVRSQDEAKVNTLLANGADINISSEDGSTALSLALKSGNTAIIDLVSKALESKAIRK